jgi:SHAQKYF class myb-like DNA-binding protein
MKENKSHKLFHVSTTTNPDKSNKLSQKLFKINTPKSNQKKPFKNVTLFINKITHMNLPYKNQNINSSNNKNSLNSSSFLKKKIRFKLYKIKQIENKKLITNVKKHNNLKENLKSKKNSKNQKNYLVGRWKLDEHQRFLEAIIKYGNDWKQVQKLVKTRSSTQARSHAQKFFIKLKQSKIMSNINIDISSENISINNLHYYLSNLKKMNMIKFFKN